MPASSSDPRAAFIEFLARVAQRNVSVADWNRFAVTRYEDPATELARRELVRECFNLSQCSTCVVPPGLEPIALRLREELLQAP